MNVRQIAIGAALVITTAAVTSQVVSQNAGDQHAVSPEEAALMQKWVAYMTPGEHHAKLDFKVGKWNGAMKMYHDANTPPTESTCTTEYKWILDGRYLVDNTQGNVMGQPFAGHAISGYDNLKKKYVWLWIDSMGTGFMHGEGEYDAATKTFKHQFDQPDLMSGGRSKGHTIERIIDNDNFSFEMHGPGMDGKVYKMMEIVYTRAK